jgi:hypothetical protein
MAKPNKTPKDRKPEAGGGEALAGPRRADAGQRQRYANGLLQLRKDAKRFLDALDLAEASLLGGSTDSPELFRTVYTLDKSSSSVRTSGTMYFGIRRANEIVR